MSISQLGPIREDFDIQGGECLVELQEFLCGLFFGEAHWGPNPELGISAGFLREPGGEMERIDLF